MRVLVTGARNWPQKSDIVVDLALMTQYRLWRRKRIEHESFVVVHGAAKGVDTTASTWVANMQIRNDGISDIEEEAHPANWKLHGRAAGPIRNREMVRAGADRCLAFPVVGSIGTYDCIRQARLAGIETLVWDMEKGRFQ